MTVNLFAGESITTASTYADACKRGVGSDTVVSWNPNDPHLSSTKLGPFNGFVVLGHELAHALHFIKGAALPPNAKDKADAKEHGGLSSSDEEDAAKDVEDQIRAEHGFDPRPK